MAINLTSGAIEKIVTGKLTSKDPGPVLQVISINSSRAFTIDNKQWYAVRLSDGSFSNLGFIVDESFIVNKLQEGSIFRLTKLKRVSVSSTTDNGEIWNRKAIGVADYNLLRSKCDIIGDPKPYTLNEIPLVVRTTQTIPDKDHANSHHVEEPPTSVQKQTHVTTDVEEHPTSIQNPSTLTQKCSSRSPTQNKKRKLQSSDDDISVFEKYISDVMIMTVEITKDVRVLYKKLETLEEDVSIMKNMMIEKTKEDDVGACYKKLETLEEDVSIVKNMMIEKTKENDVGACYKKLETLEEDVSKMAKMMMDKSKEDDMGACIEKLDKIGWVAQDPMYDTAILLFGQSADYRKLWLHLKPESCGNWVKNAGSMFGLLD